MIQSIVAVKKTTKDTVLADYQELLKEAKVEEFLQKEKTTILKDNISWHFPFPGANTTPWQLEGTILGLRQLGYQDLVAVQNKTVVTDAFKGEDLNKYKPIFQKYQIPVLFNFKDKDMKWEIFKPKRKMLVLDKIFPEGILIPDYFHDKNIVHLPTVKCHIYTTTTGAMKNAFGGLLNTKRHYTHSWIHQTLVDLLAIQKEIQAGIFAVMDGTTTGNGPGPRTMIPVVKNYLLASGDQVAIDALAAHLMGFDPLKIDYIRLAHEAGLGVGDIRQLKIIGEDQEKILKENWHFKVGDNMVSRFGDILWFGWLKKIQNFFTRTWLVNFLILGSESYHDYWRWPVKDRKVFEKWVKETEWGKLWQKY